MPDSEEIQPCECGQILTEGSWSHCWIHHVDEPVTDTTYRVCFECGHVYEAAGDLEAAHLRQITELNLHPLQPPPFAEIEWQWVPLEPKEADEIFFCQECIHDW